MSLLGTKLALSTAAHPQVDGRSERTNQSVENILRSFVEYNQADWAEKLFAAEFAINSHVSAATGEVPFLLDLGRIPATPSALWKEQLVGERAQLEQGSEGKGGITSSGAAQVLEKVSSAIQQVRDKLAIGQADVVSQRLKGRVVSEQWKVGDKVYVKREAMRDPTVDDAGVAKLLPRFVGPFVIQQVRGPATYQLLLPPHIKCHDVFNVEKLKKAVGNDFAGREEAAPGPVAQDAAGNELFEVEAIVDSKFLRGKRFYLVEWTGYRELSWEPASALRAKRVRGLIKEFEAKYQPPRSSRVMRQRGGSQAVGGASGV